MAKDIKVKEERKGDIKQLNRNVIGVQKIKNNTIKAKNEIAQNNKKQVNKVEVKFKIVEILQNIMK